jgi:hypothetical protein
MTIGNDDGLVPLRRDNRGPAVVLVRGVGEGAKNENLMALAPMLGSYGLDPNRAREVNWSWTEFVAWPYLQKFRDRQEVQTTSVPRIEFLRLLGFSVLNSASNALPSRSRWAKCIRFIVYVALWPSQLVPVLLATAPILFGLDLLGKPSVLAVVLIVFLPLAIAMISFESQLIWATFRAVVLRIFWPVFFPISVALTYGWVPFVYVGITIGIASAATYLIPAHWRYSLYSFSESYKPDTFEESTLLKFLLFVGGLFGSAVAGTLILAALLSLA